MTDKLYNKLCKVKDIEIEIDMMTLKIEELETHLYPNGIRYDLDKIQTSPEDQMSKTLAIVADLRLERDKLIYLLSESVLEVSIFIDQLEDSKERQVLHCRWISGMSPEETANHLHYSLRWMYVIQAQAIEHLEKLLD